VIGSPSLALSGTRPEPERSGVWAERRCLWLLKLAALFRLQNTLYRWDAESDFWTARQRLLIQQVFQGCKEGEPFPPLVAIRPMVK
jgi:hypothetical protein